MSCIVSPPVRLHVLDRDNFTLLYSALFYGCTCWRSWSRHCATIRKVAVSNPDGVVWNFSFTESFRQRYVSGVDSASNRNEYQEYFLGVKAAGA